MLKHRLLLIDDEEEILHSLERTLRGEGYVLLTCRSAEEAIPVVQGGRIDLIICDYGLGGMNGIDFLEKSTRERPEIIPVLLTGHADMQIAVEAVNRLVLRKFIVKPWDNAELKAAVKELLEERGKETLKRLKAKDIMSKFAITVAEGETLGKVAHLMMRFRISGLPVVSKGDKIVGIITATDLFRIMGEAVERSSGMPAHLSIDNFMTRKVHTIEKENSFLDVITVMWSNNIHTLPVVENDAIVGIIGRRDVINQYYKLFGSTDE